MKFEIGDIIKGEKGNGYTVTDENMYKAKVLDTENDKMKIEVLEHNWNSVIGESYWVDNNSKRFTKIKITKQELLDMPLGTKIITDKKENNVFIKTEKDTFTNDDGDTICDFDIYDDLSIDAYDCGDNIIKIERPEYTIVYSRDNEVKEMTIGEISEALGYEVKIIKED